MIPFDFILQFLIPSPHKPVEIYKDPLIQAINIVRQQSGLQPLASNLKLNTSAVMKALDLASNNYWQHDKFSGEKFWESIKNTGYTYKKAGENLARGYKDNQTVIDMWLNSPTHKANILDSVYTEVGIGRHKDKEGHEYVITHFGKPKIDIKSK